MPTPYNLYVKMDDLSLRKLRSKKFLRVTKLLTMKGYLAEKEEMSLREQIQAIDAVLESRRLQTKLPL